MDSYKPVIDVDDKTWLGNLAEIKVAGVYTKERWEVFTQNSGKAPFDLVAYKNGELRRVSVKGTAVKARNGIDSYAIGLRSVRSNSQGYKVKRLGVNDYDELAAYIEPLDLVVFWFPNEVSTKDQITYNHLKQSSYRFVPG